MLSPEEAQKIIKSELRKIHFPASPTDLYEPVKYILSCGGKRLRPTLTLLAAGLFTDDVSPAIPAAVGIEIFHNFTLLHDDLMDKALIRRGHPTVHVKWNPDVAVLSGDAMSMMAYRYIADSPEQVLGRILRIFIRTSVEVCEGQMFDMDFEGRDHVSEEEYITMIGLKTAVLIAASLQIGAVAAGAGDAESEDLYEYGKKLGIAFQLQDDFLDTYGDTGTFGKNIGNDILTNKKTFLAVSAMNHAPGSDRQRLRTLYSGTDQPGEQKVQEVKEIFDRCGIKEITREKIEEYYTSAAVILDALPVNDEYKKVLKDFSGSLMYRNF